MTKKSEREKMIIQGIDKIKQDIDELLREMYGLKEKDIKLRYDNFKWARDGMVRSCIIELQLSMEDILNELISVALYLARREIKDTKTKIPKNFNKSKRFKNTFTDIKKIDFYHKIRIAEELAIINKRDLRKLDQLRDIRNKCGHNWILDRKIIEKKGKGRKRRFKPFIEYKRKNLLDKKVFLEEFLPEYSPLYFRLFNEISTLYG